MGNNGTSPKQVRVWIGNIPFKTTGQDIADFCSTVGQGVIDVSVPVDRERDRIKGYAFATIILRDGAPEDDWKRLDKRMIGRRQVDVQLETGRRLAGKR